MEGPTMNPADINDSLDALEERIKQMDATLSAEEAIGDRGDPLRRKKMEYARKNLNMNFLGLAAARKRMTDLNNLVTVLQENMEKMKNERQEA